MLTLRQYMYLGVMGALSFVLAFVLGNAVNVATGIPLSGGIVNGIIVGIMLTLGVKGVNKFGSATIIWVIFAILATPTMTLGPPGPHKIVVGLFAGIVWDIVIAAFNRKNIGYIIGGGAGSAVIVIGMFVMVVALGLPAEEELRKAIVFLLLFNTFLGLVCTYLGVMIFEKKVANLPFIKGLNE